MNTTNTAKTVVASTRNAAPRGHSMRALRRFVLFICTAMLLMASFIAWRAMNPELSDREQISAQMEEMRAAVEARSASGIAKNVGGDFAWNGLDARTFRASLAQAFVQWRDVKLSIPSQKTEVRGASATTSGRYSIALREAESSTPQTFKGDFSVQWNRTRNGWRISGLRGGEELLGTLQN